MSPTEVGDRPAPESEGQLKELVLKLPFVKATGGGSKPPLSHDATISMAAMRGVIEYLPEEYTIAVRAGTPIEQMIAILREHGQFLPFDPPLSSAGATIGGTVAAGISGPGRFRYGGVRDFLLGVTFMSGDGRIIHGGGKVVKNAAGFDIPKLMVGGLGNWGLLTELTFKVFPHARETLTGVIETDSWSDACRLVHLLSVAPLDLVCLELEAPNTIWLRIGGQAASLEQRFERVRRLCGGDSWRQIQPDSQFWQDAANFIWADPSHALVRMAINPTQMDLAETTIAENSRADQLRRRYGVGGNVLWMSGPNDILPEIVQHLSAKLSCPALAIRGTWDRPGIGGKPPTVFSERLHAVFDPQRRFVHPHPQTAQ
jgi:glycolate oxidase FAD binding subunit